MGEELFQLRITHAAAILVKVLAAVCPCHMIINPGLLVAGGLELTVAARNRPIIQSANIAPSPVESLNKAIDNIMELLGGHLGLRYSAVFAVQLAHQRSRVLRVSE
ncbi:hypothetical protein D3C75_1078170 [compost metagenome]